MSIVWESGSRNEKEGNSFLIGIEGYLLITKIEDNLLTTGKGPRRNRREEWYREKSKGSVSQRLTFHNLQDPVTPLASGTMPWVKPCSRYLNPHFWKKLKEQICRADSLGRPSPYMMVRLISWNMSAITIRAWQSIEMRPWCVRYSLPAWGQPRWDDMMG